MNRTDIEYLDYSWNVTHGCSPISPGCSQCWAKATSKRLAGMGVRGYSKDEPFKVVCCPWKLDEPFKIKKPSRIGVSFMGDLFHEDVPDEFLAKVFQTMVSTSNHIFMILTKRPERMRGYLRFGVKPWIWLGVTAENQEQADKRIPILLQIPAAKRFVSFEPLLSEINIEKYLHCGISWCIIGSESGTKARPMDENWVRSLVCQCKKNDVAVFYKQKRVNGKMIKMPKLDGKIYAEYPQTTNRQSVL